MTTMNKRLNKHQKKQNFVKIYLADDKGNALDHFSGIVLEHNTEIVMMIDLLDFNYDGYVIFRKSHICEIKHSKNEEFFQKILSKENLLEPILNRCQPIKLGEMEDMFKQLKKRNLPIIIERLYDSEDIFQIGPIHSVSKKSVRINYFNARGEFELKPVVSKYKSITFFRVDSTYANLFNKYTKKLR